MCFYDDAACDMDRYGEEMDELGIGLDNPDDVCQDSVVDMKDVMLSEIACPEYKRRAFDIVYRGESFSSIVPMALTNSGKIVVKTSGGKLTSMVIEDIENICDRLS